MAEDADVIVVGGGLAGLVAATEIADAGSASSSSTRKANKALADKPFGRSADCFWSTRPNNADSALRIATI